MTVGVLYLLITTTIKLLDVRFTTRLLAETDTTLTFPAVTICPANAIRKSYLKKHPTHRRLLQEMFGWNPSLQSLLYESPEQAAELANTSIDNINITQVFTEGAHRLQEMLIEAKALPNTQLGENFQLVMTDISACYQVKTNVTVRRSGKEGGMLFVLNAQQDEYVLPVVAEALAGFMLSIHDTRDSPSLGQRGIIVSPGTYVFMSITKTVYEYADGYGCVRKDSYSRSRCEDKCAYAFIVRRCGCRLYNWEVPAPRICRQLQDMYCVGNEFAENYTSEVEAECACQRRCDEVSYDVQVSSADYPAPILKDIFKKGFDEYNISVSDVTIIRLYYRDLHVIRVQQERAYTFGDFWGDVGGYMGLCLGASIMTLIELVDFLIRAVVRCLPGYKARTGTGASRVDNVVPKQNLDPAHYQAWPEHKNPI